MRIPPNLKKGDTIGIVAPAGKIDKEKLLPVMNCFHSWGYEVVLGKNIFSQFNTYSGTDEQRAEDLQAMLDNPMLKAIFCARGGYGTLRIIDKLNFSNFTKHPKWVMGFSDITVLHAHIHTQFKIQTLHSQMSGTFLKSESSIQSLRKAITGEHLQYEMPAHPLNRSGRAEGLLVGGNLSIIHALMGSTSEFDTDDKILFIEDLDEYLYHLDRMLLSLKRARKLRKLKGILLGGFTQMKDNNISFGKTAEAIIREHVDEYNYPVCFNVPSGHIDNNHTLIMGSMVQLLVDSKGSSLNFVKHE